MQTSGAGREWLDVAFAEKDEAKAAGARWDPQARRWYVGPRADRERLARFTPRPPLPETLPGELRTFPAGQGLFVDLIPRSCWFTNVRSCVEPRDWERLRKLIIDRTGNECETCYEPPDREHQLYMECHERWHYDDQTHTQRLVRLLCLCTRCHEATHMGLAKIRRREFEAIEQLTRVEGWTFERAEEHVEAAFELWRERNRTNWTLDLTILTDAGIQIRRPPDARDRADVAEAELARQPERA